MKSTLRTLFSGAIRAIRKLAFPFVIRLYTCTKVGVLNVVQMVGEEDPSLSAKTVEALQLIKYRDPRRFARLTRDCRWVVIATLDEPGGEYWPSLNVCALDAGYVRRAPVERIALVLVHEATHARLSKQIGEHRATERVEKICVRAEIAFASKLENADQHIARIRESFQKAWWSRPNAKDTSRRLRELGVPRWLIRLRSYLGD